MEETDEKKERLEVLHINDILERKHHEEVSKGNARKAYEKGKLGGAGSGRTGSCPNVNQNMVNLIGREVRIKGDEPTSGLKTTSKIEPGEANTINHINKEILKNLVLTKIDREIGVNSDWQLTTTNLSNLANELSANFLVLRDVIASGGKGESFLKLVEQIASEYMDKVRKTNSKVKYSENDYGKHFLRLIWNIRRGCSDKAIRDRQTPKTNRQRHHEQRRVHENIFQIQKSREHQEKTGRQAPAPEIQKTEGNF